MTVLFVVLLGIGVFLGLVFFVRSFFFSRFLIKNFKARNVIVDGKKGTGKDLLFQYVIHKRHARYYANIDFDGPTRYYKRGKKKGQPKPKKLIKLVSGGDMNVSPNTYLQFINGEVDVVPRDYAHAFEENADVYISDGGIYFPSQMDSVLHKQFPSFPIYYALSRHLAHHNIHINTQNVGRVWKALREQADFFVHVVRNIKLPGIILVKCWTYDNVNSAMSLVRPIKSRLFNKFSKSNVDLHRSQNGIIKGGWIIIRKRYIKYDTRAFEKLIYANQCRLVPKKRINLFSRALTKLKTLAQLFKRKFKRKRTGKSWDKKNR